MIELYMQEMALKAERALLDKQVARRSAWEEGHAATGPRRIVRLRRQLALLLMALADRLDPRPVIAAAHVPCRPTMNGKLHHA